MGAVFFNLALIAAEPDLVATLGEERAARVQHVEAALESNPDLLRQHRNYLAILDAYPPLRTTESTFTNLMLGRPFGDLVTDFEDYLGADTNARALFLAYNAYLARNDRARAGADTLFRMRLARPGLGEEFNRSMDYLMSNPARGLQFLTATSAGPPPDELAPLFERFDEDPFLRESLVAGLQQVDDESAARRLLYPWWQASLGEDAGLSRRFLRLNRFLLANPRAYWAWTERNLEWAGHPGLLEWVQSFHRDLRQTGLYDDYLAYLDVLRDHPELRDRAEARWEKRFGRPTAPEADDAAQAAIREQARPSPAPAVNRPKVPNPVVTPPQRPKRPQVSSPSVDRPKQPRPPRRPSAPTP